METAKQIADLLTGTEYDRFGNEETNIIFQKAKAAGLVVVYGESDDLMEFRGAFYDEFGCYDGGEVALTDKGVFTNDCNDDECPYFNKKLQELKANGAFIEAVWDNGEVSWSYKTNIAHETFDIIEDGEVYCKGIVFRVADIPEWIQND